MVTVLHEGPPVITERQLQVIELIAAGCSNDEVARRLGISPRTAKAHSDVIRQKLGCKASADSERVPDAHRPRSPRSKPRSRTTRFGGLTAPAPAAERSQARSLQRSLAVAARSSRVRRAGVG